MIKLESHLGSIDVSHGYLVNIVGNTVINCFGVVAMASTGVRQGFLAKLDRGNTIDKGIRIRVKNQKLIIDIHILVHYGTNITAVVQSIMHKVQFVVEEKTGFKVAKVNVFVDGMAN